ncbi:hypothetical protein EDB85DRAFT_2148211 [Lactarius pseudohatsudake]|nr:hypothetical protein EDB85DRAFT_2148211 [Lactarius pseudohatsudake]
MALLIVSTGQFAIDLGKCTILTGGAPQASREPSTSVTSMPFWGCCSFSPRGSTPALVFPVRVDAGARLPPRVIIESPTIPTPKPIPNDAIQICSQALVRAPQGGVEGLKKGHWVACNQDKWDGMAYQDGSEGPPERRDWIGRRGRSVVWTDSIRVLSASRQSLA